MQNLGMPVLIMLFIGMLIEETLRFLRGRLAQCQRHRMVGSFKELLQQDMEIVKLGILDQWEPPKILLQYIFCFEGQMTLLHVIDNMSLLNRSTEHRPGYQDAQKPSLCSYWMVQII